MTPKQDKGIISLLVVLSVGFFAFITVLTVTTGILSELHKNQNSVSGDQVFYSSETALKEVTTKFIDEYTAAADKTPYMASPYSHTYSASTIPGINDSTLSDIEVTGEWPYYTVNSVSNNPRTNRVTENYLTVYAPGLALDFAIFSNEDLNIDGNATINGDIFTNEDIVFGNSGGGSATVNGDASSVGDINNENKVTGESSEGVEIIDPPPIDLLPYYDVAFNAADPGNDNYFTTIGSASAKLSNKTSSGIFYVDTPADKLTLNANTQITGSLIVTGDLELKGREYTVGDPDHFVAIYVGGNLTFNGNVTINGTIYVQGSTSFGSGNVTVNGSIISVGGAVNVNGSVVVNFDPALVVDLGELIGGNTIAVDPRILLWKEL